MKLHAEYRDHLPDSAIISFDERLPQDVSLVSNLFLGSLVVSHGLVDVPGGGWECKSVNRVGRQRRSI